MGGGKNAVVFLFLSSSVSPLLIQEPRLTTTDKSPYQILSALSWAWPSNLNLCLFRGHLNTCCPLDCERKEKVRRRLQKRPQSGPVAYLRCRSWSGNRMLMSPWFFSLTPIESFYHNEEEQDWWGTRTQNRRACCLIVSAKISCRAALEGKAGSRPRLCCHTAVCNMLTAEGSDISPANSCRQQVLLLYCNKLIWGRSRLVLHDEVGWSLLCTLIIFKINMTMPALDVVGLRE